MTTECSVTLGGVGERRSPLASGSVGEHLFRGAVGLTAAILAIMLVAVVGPISLVLLLVTVFAWRGCPTCWTVGLLGTLADNHARGDCSRCQPAAAPLSSKRPGGPARLDLPEDAVGDRGTHVDASRGRHLPLRGSDVRSGS
jgi:hypothetical protein